jgi:hypothetical protein
MTVPSSSNRMEYTGNGVASSFDYTFQIFADSDLQVYVLDTDGVQTELVLATDFTVSGAGDPDGGSITLTAGALTVGYELVILREVPLTQEVDLRNQGAYYPETVETMGDRLMMGIQQLAERLGRSLIKAVTGGTIDAGGARITNVGAPFASTDAATFGSVAAAEAAAAASAAAAAASESAAAGAESAAITARDDAIDAKDAAEAAAAGVNLPSIVGGDTGKILRVNGAEDGYELTAALLDGEVTAAKLAANIQMPVLLSTADITAVSSIDLPSIFSDNPEYRHYRVALDGFLVSGTNRQINLRISKDGSTFESGATSYRWHSLVQRSPDTSISETNSTGDSKVVLGTGFDGNGEATLILDFLSPQQTSPSRNFAVKTQVITSTNNTATLRTVIGGLPSSVSLGIQGLQLYIESATNFQASGTIKVYGSNAPF